MPTVLNLSIEVDRSQEGAYFTLPFQVPEGIESIALSYRYPRRSPKDQPVDRGLFTARDEVNIIDLGLIDPQGVQVGASGSDKVAHPRWGVQGRSGGCKGRLRSQA